MERAWEWTEECATRLLNWCQETAWSKTPPVSCCHRCFVQWWDCCRTDWCCPVTPHWTLCTLHHLKEGDVHHVLRWHFCYCLHCIQINCMLSRSIILSCWFCWLVLDCIWLFVVFTAASVADTQWCRGCISPPRLSANFVVIYCHRKNI